jgi:hypothetical protein
MSSFKEDMDKRMRRVCGVVDDSLPVVFHEHLTDSNWSGYADDTDFGASYEISVVVYEEDNIKRVASVTFSSLYYFINALESVKFND